MVLVKMDLPKWLRIAIAGGITAVVLNYFLQPSLNKLL